MSDVERYVPKATKNPKGGDVNIKLKWGKIITVAQKDFKRIKKFFKVDSIVETIEDKVILKYIIGNDVPVTRSILSGYEDDQNVKSIEVDGQIVNSNTYNFTTSGEHIIKYELNDKSCVGNTAPLISQVREISEIIIPEGVTTLKHNAFAGGVTIPTIILPSTLNLIYAGAFGGDSVTNFTIKAVIPPTTDNAALPMNVTNCYVPAESLEAYKQADNWRVIANYIQPIPE